MSAYKKRKTRLEAATSDYVATLAEMTPLKASAHVVKHYPGAAEVQDKLVKRAAIIREQTRRANEDDD